MNKKLYFILLFTIFFIAILLFSNSCSNKSNKTVYIKSYKVILKNTNNDIINLANNNNEIFYYNTRHQKVFLKNVISDDKGCIRKQTISIPKNVKKIYFNHWLSNKKLGTIIDKNGKKVKVSSNVDISDNTISYNNKINLVNNAHKTYLYANTWNIYQNLLNDQKNAVNYTISELKKNKNIYFKKIYFKPIKIMCNFNDKNSGALTTCTHSQGILKKNEKYIIVNLKNNDSLVDSLKVYLSHEWAHWNMYQSIGKKGMTVSSYKTHLSYNNNQNVSYKEGWALFQANRSTWGYNMNTKLDTTVQTSNFKNHKFGNKQKLFGKSTNATVYNVLRDFYDLENIEEGKNDQYNIAEDVFNNHSYTNKQKEQLSNGLLFLAMFNSKATTLEKLIFYLDKNFVNDKTSFKNVLKINGLNENGQFTLDKNNHPINNH